MINVKDEERILPEVEDNITIQGWINPQKGSNYISLMNELQTIGHYDAKIAHCTIQKGSIDLVKLNYNFEHVLLSKISG